MVELTFQKAKQNQTLVKLITQKTKQKKKIMKLFLISLLISIIPGIVIIWPFIFKTNSLELLEKQISSDKKMSVKWETTISKLTTAKLDFHIGKLSNYNYEKIIAEQNDEMLKIIEKLDASNTDKKMFLEKLQEKIDSKI